MSRTQQRIARAAQRARHNPRCVNCGYELDDGETVDACPNCGGEHFADPVSVQKVAIEEGFRNAADEPTFDINTVVNLDRYIQPGQPLYANFERVANAYFDTTDRPELKQRVAELIEQAEVTDGE